MRQFQYLFTGNKCLRKETCQITNFEKFYFSIIRIQLYLRSRLFPLINEKKSTVSCVEFFGFSNLKLVRQLQFFFKKTYMFAV